MPGNALGLSVFLLFDVLRSSAKPALARRIVRKRQPGRTVQKHGHSNFITIVCGSQELCGQAGASASAAVEREPRRDLELTRLAAESLWAFGFREIACFIPATATANIRNTTTTNTQPPPPLPPPALFVNLMRIRDISARPSITILVPIIAMIVNASTSETTSEFASSSSPSSSPLLRRHHAPSSPASSTPPAAA